MTPTPKEPSSLHMGIGGIGNSPKSPKEGPPTLRECRGVLEYAERKHFDRLYPYTGTHSRECPYEKMLDRLTDEALERDEKRRAALEIERVRYKEALQKLFDLANTEYHPHSYTVNGSDVKKISSDALTPTPDQT